MSDSIWDKDTMNLLSEILEKMKTEPGYAADLRGYDPNRGTVTYTMLAHGLSNRLGVDIHPQQLRSAMRRRGMNMSKLGNNRKASFDKVLDIKCEKGVLVVADLHAPYQNNELLDIASKIAVHHFGVDTVVIAGDLFNFDTVSRHGIQGFEVELEEEFEAAKSILQYLMGAFSYIYITNGNHDERLRARLQQFLKYQRLIDMLVGPDSGIVATDYDYLYVTLNEWNRWVLGHLSGYNKRPGELAKNMCHKFRANIAVGHDHIQGFTSTPDNKYLAISTGAMIALDEQGNSPLWYKEKRLNTYSPIKNGFLILEGDGTPHLFDDKGSVCLSGAKPFSFYNMGRG